MSERDKTARLKKIAEDHAVDRFDEAWENVLKEDCQPWQREAIETAFKMGFFEGLGYAGKIITDAVDDE